MEGRTEIVVGRLEKGGSGLLVEGRVGDDSVGLLVDTGATVNMLSLSWWRTHGEPGTFETTTELVYSVEGRPLRLHGRVTADVRISRKIWEVTFELSEIPTDAILGCRFLRESGYMVDLAGERLLLGVSDGEDEEEELQFCRVICSETTVIGPGEEALVEGYLAGDWTGEDDGLIEGLREVEMNRGLLVGRGLINTHQPYTPVRIFNPGQDPVTLYKDMTLASLEPVGGVEQPVTGETPSTGGENTRESCRMISSPPPTHRGRDQGHTGRPDGRGRTGKEGRIRRTLTEASFGIPTQAWRHRESHHSATPNQYGRQSPNPHTTPQASPA